MLREILHLSAALHFTFAVYYFLFQINIPSSIESVGDSFGGKFKFLTFWDVVVQCVFFWICVLNNYIGSNEANLRTEPEIRKIKDKFFCSIGFPLSAFVCLTFWGIYAVDRQLILPVEMDPYFPTWFNHMVHTNVFLFPLIEFVTIFRKYPPRKECLTALIYFMLTYLCWILFIYAKAGLWVYPVMRVLNWPLRIIFCLTLLFFIVGIYMVQEALNAKIWNAQLVSLRSSNPEVSRKAN